MTPELKARGSIDALLVAAGRRVCDAVGANNHAATGVAIRELPLNAGYGFADYLLYVNGKACGFIEAIKEGSTCPSSAKSRSTPTSCARRRYGRPPCDQDLLAPHGYTS